LGNYNVDIGEKAIDFLADISNGDARIALNAIELAVSTSETDVNGKISIDVQTIEDCIQKRSITFDKSGESHYDNISAFIKSMRGSSPDAAVFYLARALYAGEDPEFLARRIIICASEDVGMANPSALQVAVAAAQAVKMIGMPEARIILSHAAVMVATSPKSNSCYMAIEKALDDIKNRRTGEVPMHLRNAAASGMKDLGYGKDYKYAHDYHNNIVDQEYLPDEIRGTVYYNPGSNGYELRIKEWLDRRRQKGGQA
jgi:putative ATPase